MNCSFKFFVHSSVIITFVISTVVPLETVAANRLIDLNGLGATFSFAYDGLGNRYQQTANGETTTYLLDLAGELSQVLYDDTTAYFYGLERLAQQVNGGNYEYFLPDRLGSVRQVAGESGFPSFAQEFDPYGNLTGYEGMGGSSYSFAGEFGDPSGLVYLRARYYSPIQGRFITRDPFPGVLSQPATMNPYAYALNNPALYTDPSGEFVLPFIVAAVIGGVFSAGADVLAQMLTMGPGDFGQKLRCVDWGQVGLSFAAGAVAGFTGFTVFGGVTALLGTGFLVNVGAGALSGIIAGQYGILTYLTLSGQTDQLRSSMFRWQDIVLDATLGGTISGVTYGLSMLFSNPKTSVTPKTIKVTNPNGRLGSPEHQAVIKNLEQQIKAQGLTPKTEYRINTPGGIKPYRFVDIAALDSNRNPVTLYQVGRITKTDIPIARELQAITDIILNSDFQIPIKFIPFNN